LALRVGRAVWRRSRGGGGGGGGGAGHDQALSRKLSRLLRHSAVEEGVAIRADGYVALNDVFALPRFKGFSLDQVRAVVADNDKKRFGLLEEDGKVWIRANQGHSMNVVQSSLLLEQVDLASIATCLHGTNMDAWNAIKAQGLRRMGRNQIHFAEGLPGESGVISGMRRSAQVLIYLNTAAAAAAGLVMMRSANDVLLTAGFDVGGINGIIPPCLFSKVVHRATGNLIYSGDASLLPSPPWPLASPENPGGGRAAGGRPAPKGAMSKKKAKGTCRAMAKVLMHTAPEHGVEIAADGFTSLAALKSVAAAEISGLSSAELFATIDGSNGLLSTRGDRDSEAVEVRANFGHSLPHVTLKRKPRATGAPGDSEPATAAASPPVPAP